MSPISCIPTPRIYHPRAHRHATPTDTQTHDLIYIQRTEWSLGQPDAAGSIGAARFPPFCLRLPAMCPRMAMYLFYQNQNARQKQPKCKLQCNHRQQDVP